MNGFEVANLFIKNSKNEESLTKWISVKQASWLLSTMSNEKSFIHDVKIGTEGMKSSSSYIIKNENYKIELAISPMNKAGKLTIDYKELKGERVQTEYSQKVLDQKAKIPQLEKDIKEWEADKTPAKSEFLKRMNIQTLENMKKELITLKEAK